MLVEHWSSSRTKDLNLFRLTLLKQHLSRGVAARQINGVATLGRTNPKSLLQYWSSRNHGGSNGVPSLSLLIRNFSLGLNKLSQSSVDPLPTQSTSQLHTKCSGTLLFISLYPHKRWPLRLSSVAASNLTTALLMTPSNAAEEQCSCLPLFPLYSGQQHSATYRGQGKLHLPTGQHFPSNLYTVYYSQVHCSFYENIGKSPFICMSIHSKKQLG